MRRKKAADDLARALVEAHAMDETKRYLVRGRVYADLALDELKSRWTQGFKDWMRTRTAESQTLFDDLSAELRLRSEPEPFDTIEEEFAAMRKELLQIGPEGSEALRNAIAEFLLSLDEPQN